MMNIIRLAELKYAIRLVRDNLATPTIVFILKSCNIPEREASYIEKLSRQIYNKRYLASLGFQKAP